jgi:hypothetical protein
MNLVELPADIYENIFCHMYLQVLPQCLSVSKHWNDYAKKYCLIALRKKTESFSPEILDAFGGIEAIAKFPIFRIKNLNDYRALKNRKIMAPIELGFDNNGIVFLTITMLCIYSSGSKRKGAAILLPESPETIPPFWSTDKRKETKRDLWQICWGYNGSETDFNSIGNRAYQKNIKYERLKLIASGKEYVKYRQGYDPQDRWTVTYKLANRNFNDCSEW